MGLHKQYLEISNPGYVKEALHQLNHKTPKKSQHHPYLATESTYCADTQKMKPIDTSPSLSMEQVKQIQRIIGKFLYYYRGEDNT